eukprot:TRINITY_DN9173_c1_g1_i1.p1 TRINITY_DN9173_c1_g1~~TRINITY_DN9173_c1_g1_i1.p1  ORF type:complete len:135 (+),score=34.12 TRINITY_DN9173_c1_g1_i1:54-458(+)
MLRATGTRMGASLNTRDLFRQIEPTPMRNWRGVYEEKLAPHATTKEAIHKHMEHVYGKGYDTMNEANFPYPLMYSIPLFLWMMYLFCGDDWANPTGTEHPWLTFNPKNADGSTVMPLEPCHPSPLFAESVSVRN